MDCLFPTCDKRTRIAFVENNVSTLHSLPESELQLSYPLVNRKKRRMALNIKYLHLHGVSLRRKKFNVALIHKHLVTEGKLDVATVYYFKRVRRDKKRKEISPKPEDLWRIRMIRRLFSYLLHEHFLNNIQRGRHKTFAKFIRNPVDHKIHRNTIIQNVIICKSQLLSRLPWLSNWNNPIWMRELNKRFFFRFEVECFVIILNILKYQKNNYLKVVSTIHAGLETTNKSEYFIIYADGERIPQGKSETRR